MARLFIGIRRDGQPDHNSLYSLLTSTLSSGGDDIARSFSDLDNSAPYFIASSSPAPIPIHEKVTVVAGLNLHLHSDTDDMKAHVQATHWWRLDELMLQVI